MQTFWLPFYLAKKERHSQSVFCIILKEAWKIHQMKSSQSVSIVLHFIHRRSQHLLCSYLRFGDINHSCISPFHIWNMWSTLAEVMHFISIGLIYQAVPDTLLFTCPHKCLLFSQSLSSTNFTGNDFAITSISFMKMLATADTGLLWTHSETIW